MNLQFIVGKIQTTADCTFVAIAMNNFNFCAFSWNNMFLLPMIFAKIPRSIFLNLIPDSVKVRI